MSEPSDAVAPEWAVKQAQAALQKGMSSLEVEQRLTAVGLTAQAAREAVSRAPAAPPPMLNDAMEQVRAALKAGVKVPDIERQLVAKGLPAEIAETVTTRVLGEQVRGRLPDTPERQRRRTLHQIASASVAVLCFLLAFWFGGVLSILRAALVLFAPLCAIWFGDLSGPLWVRFGGRGPVFGVVVRWLGWLVLALYLLYRTELILYRP